VKQQSCVIEGCQGEQHCCHDTQQHSWLRCTEQDDVVCCLAPCKMPPSRVLVLSAAAQLTYRHVR
jgi:hypothetical protein